MKLSLRLAGPPAAVLLLTACATSPVYPSLAIPDHGRVTGTMQPVASAPFTPTAPAPDTLARVDTLVNQAQAAHQAFLDAVPATRSTLQAAAGAAPASDAWDDAQVALADLEIQRATTMIALADLDMLYDDAAIHGKTLDKLGDARDRIAGLIERESAVVSQMPPLADAIGSAGPAPADPAPPGH